MGEAIDKLAKAICLVVLLFATILFIAVLFGGDGGVDDSAPAPVPPPAVTIDDIKNSALQISYDDLMRNSDDHIGEVVYKRGEILQVSERYGDKYVLRIATQQSTYGYYDDIIWVEYEGNRLLEGDIIDVWGESKGLETYGALLGNQVTIPKIDSMHVELVTKAGDNME